MRAVITFRDITLSMAYGMFMSEHIQAFSPQVTISIITSNYMIVNGYCFHNIIMLVGDRLHLLTLKVLVTKIDAQWEGMGDVGSARYEPALLPPCPTIRVLSYSN